MLAKVGLLKCSKLFLRIEHQYLERIEVEQLSGDGDTVARDDAVEPILRKDFGRRIEQRLFELGRRTSQADVGEVGAKPRTFTLDPVAGLAHGLPSKDDR